MMMMMIMIILEACFAWLGFAWLGALVLDSISFIK
jgi:hypothetical protein